jgi:N-methylhydantoinase A
MARAVRAVTIERGRDPRDFALIAFGGNGPLFAPEMARSLEIGTVLVPPAPGVLSALGLLAAEVEHHLVKTFLRPLAALRPGELASAVAALEVEAEEMLRGEGYLDAVEISRAVDLKYQGQSFELTIPLPHAWAADGAPAEIAKAFGAEHERTYGHKAEGDPVQLVNLRLTARVPRSGPPAAPHLARTAPGAQGARLAYFGPGHGSIRTPVIGRFDLGKRPQAGPLLVDEYDATTLVPPGFAACLDDHDNIIISTGA